MSRTIEDTVKALTEFEADLEAARKDAEDAAKRLAKGTSEWTDAAKKASLEKAQSRADQIVAKAKRSAEERAETIKKTGRSNLSKFEQSLSKKKGKAVELATARLLGEGA